MVQMAAAERLFLAMSYSCPAMFYPDVHLPLAGRLCTVRDVERFVVVVVVVAV